MNTTFQLDPWVACLHCSAPVPIQNEITIEYFRGVQTICPKCEKTLDWWKTVLQTIRGNFMLVQAFAPVGARWTILNITLRPNLQTEVKFADHGVPADANILSVNYTPQGGGLFPIEIHGNTPQRHVIPPIVYLWPRPLGEGSHSETTVNVMVTWVPHTAEDEAWQNLIDAFQAYVIGRYQSEVVPANVAVESKLARLLAKFLYKSAKQDNVDSFLKDGATYGHQLNVLLPALLSRTGAPRLPTHIHTALNRLKNLRHQMAHRGVLDNPLEKDEAAELLCAALFVFHYLNLIRPILLEQKDKSA